MKIRKIALLIAVAILAFASLLYWGVSQKIIGGQYNDMERWLLKEDLHRLRSAILDQLSGQAKVNRDYAQWDDTYQFQQDLNSEYFEDNLGWSVLKNMEIEHFIVLDSMGKLRFHVGAKIHGIEGDTLGLPSSLLQILDIHQGPLSRTGAHVVSWIQPTATGPYLVSADLITQSNQSASIKSWLVFARKFDASLVNLLQKRVRQDIKLLDGLSSLQKVRILDRVGKISEEDVLYQKEHQSNTGLSVGYLLVGQGEGVVLQLERPRQIESTGLANLEFMFIIMISMAFVLVLGTYLMIEWILLKPLVKLEQRFVSIGEANDLSIRMPPQYSHELQSVARTINRVLERMQESQQQLLESEHQYRSLASELKNTHQFLTQVVNFLPDATFAVDSKGLVVAWNRAMEELTGSNSRSMLGQSIEKVQRLIYGSPHSLLMETFFHPNLQQDLFPEARLEDGAIRYEEFVALMDHRQGKFLDQTAIALRDSTGNFLGALQTIRDVTGQKKAEMRLEFLSLHDPLTGLYNRTYFTEAGEAFAITDNLPLSVIVVDLDGLKLVNDTLGHDHGDALLIAAADLLKKCFIGVPVARVGGDEFVILLSKTSESNARIRLEDLRAVIQEYNQSNPPLPVEMSLGLTTSTQVKSVNELFKEADAQMYREKDIRRESVRLSYVASLQRRFEELHRKERSVTDRLVELTKQVGEFMNLETHTIERIELLARYRDIGKVGLSDRVMLKSGNLEGDEVNEIRKQPEIGYRIAKISRELMPIADLILKQREWWDGHGYPLGLSGEMIPFENRFLAVLEAYVVMTSPRHRSRSLNSTEAIQEIKAMAGFKLDPSMVEHFRNFLLRV